MTDVLLGSEAQKELKKLVIARKLALNYDYCIDEREAKKEIKHIYECYFDKNKVTKKEILEACSENSGRRSDEIENELSQKLETILDL